MQSCVHAMSDATGKFTMRWTDHRRHGGTAASKEINSKFLDCEFHVKSGVTSMQLLDTVKHNVSCTNDSTGKKCTPETYPSHHFIGGHDERFGGCGQTSSKRGNIPP